MVGCSVMNCTNRTEHGFRFFRYPSDVKRLKQWIHNTKRQGKGKQNWIPGPGARICEVHFETSQFETNREDGWTKLKPNAIPTLVNVPNPPQKFAADQRKSTYRIEKNDRKEDNLENARIAYNYKYMKKVARSPLCSIENIHSNIPSVTECLDQDARPDDADRIAGSDSTMQGGVDYNTEAVGVLKKRILELENENTSLRSTLQTAIMDKEKEIDDFERKIEKLESEVKEKSDILMSFLTRDQINLLYKKKIMEYSKETIVKSLKLRFKLGVKNYNDLIEDGYPAPTYRTLNRRLQSYEVNTGMLENFCDLLKYKSESMKSSERVCCLSIDEMQIDESKDYDKYKKIFNGYCTLGDTTKLATHFLVALVRGVKSPWKQVIGCATTTGNTSADNMKKFLFECLDFIEDCGLTAMALTSDMGNTNVTLWVSLGISVQRHSPIVNYFLYKGREIYVVADPCHLLKNLRNALLTQDLKISENTMKEENLPTQVISGTYVEMLWQAEMRANKSIRSLHHLKPEDICPNNFQKMHVGSAVRYFSHKTVAALKMAITNKIIPFAAQTTVWFIHCIAEWFELISSRIAKKGCTRKNKLKKKEIFGKTMRIMREIEVGVPRWKPLNYGFVLSNSSLLDVTEMLFEFNDDFKFILYSQFAQDALENVFSQIRRRVGLLPTVSLCLKAIKLISVSQYIGCVPQGANYLRDSDEFLVEYFSKKKKMAVDETPSKACSILPNFEEKFPTYDFMGDTDTNLLKKFNAYDLNLLFYISGSVMNSLLNLKFCNTCLDFLNSNIIDDVEYKMYTDELNKGGLHSPNVSIFNLVLSCEVIYNKYEAFLLRNTNNEDFIKKLVNDIDIEFPLCNICLNMKYKAIVYHFNVKSNGITSLHACYKRKKVIYGTATAKRRKV